MKMMLLLLLSLLLPSVLVEDVEEKSSIELDIPEEEGVLVLDEINIDIAIYRHDFLVVEFYAPWCSHCQELAPIYKETAKELAKKGSKVRLAKIDVDVWKSVGEKFNVEGYPTIKLFRNGNPITFRGQRTTKNMVDWFEKKQVPAYTEIKEVELFQNIMEEEAFIVVGFFQNPNGEKANIFKDVAELLMKFKFYLITEKEVLEYFQQEHQDAVMVIKTDATEREIVSMDKITFHYLDEKIRRLSMPLVNEYDSESLYNIFNSGVNNQFLFISERKDTIYKSFIPTLEEFAKEYYNKIVIVHVDIDVEEVMEYFGITSDDCPTFVLVDGDSSRYMPSSDERDITASNVEKFLKDFLAGKLVKQIDNDEKDKTEDDTEELKIKDEL